MSEVSTEWVEKISAWRQSGKSGAAWCRDNGISYYQFQYWRDKLRHSASHAKTGRFVPLRVASPSLRIECYGVYLHVSPGFDAVLLRQVVSALRGN